MIISVHIDVTKILKDHLVKGEKGIYLNLDLKDGVESQYGNDFIVVQDIGKEARQQGLRGPILGNGKYLSREPMATRHSTPPQTPPTEDVPF